MGIKKRFGSKVTELYVLIGNAEDFISIMMLRIHLATTATEP